MYYYDKSIPLDKYKMLGTNHVPNTYQGSLADWRNTDVIEKMRLKKAAEGMKLGFHTDQQMTPEQQQAFGRVVADSYQPMRADEDPNTLAYAMTNRYGGDVHLPEQYPNADLTHESGHVLDSIFARDKGDWRRDGTAWTDKQSEKVDATAPGSSISTGRSVFDMATDGKSAYNQTAQDLQQRGDTYLNRAYDEPQHNLEETANTVWWRTHNPQELMEKNPQMNNYLNEQIKAQEGLWEILSKRPNIWGNGPTNT